MSSFGINKPRDISARLSYGCVLDYVRINLFLMFFSLYALFNYYRFEQISISTCYIMLHHVTLHGTLKLLDFTIVLDMLLHVTPLFLKGNIDFFKARYNML